MSENLPERVSSFRQALESAGTPRLGSMGAPNRDEGEIPTIPTALGRELAGRRFLLEEEQKETVKLIDSTNKRMAELYIDANREMRLATGQVMGENEKITSKRQKAYCDTFEKFTSEDLGFNLVEDMRWGKAQVQDTATRFKRVEPLAKPRAEESVPKEMTLRRKTTGGVLGRILGRGEEIWEVDG